MKVVHITPTYFDSSSIIGGGERYVVELSRRMAQDVDTTLVSFADRRESYLQDALKIELYPVQTSIKGNKFNPFNLCLFSQILNADVVHFHHINTLTSDLGCLLSASLGKPAFVTDYGGGANFVLNQRFPIFRCYQNAVIYSQFMLDCIPSALQKKAVLIKGGIDVERYCPDTSLPKEKKILYVGRILPHKGINYLIDAFRRLEQFDYVLKIVGRVYSEKFYRDLKQLAEGLPIEFIHDADDQQLMHEYRTAMVNVLPSVHTDCYGNYTPVPELMGFTLLEAQACGTPVICTDAGAMHEFVEDGRTGFVVKQNSGEAIAKALQKLIDLTDAEFAIYQQSCQQLVNSLSWSTVVKKHLQLYRTGSQNE